MPDLRIEFAAEAPSKKYFQGETMVCALCSRREPSAAGVETQWRVLEADGRPYYFCGAHFPADGASAGAYQAAYRRSLDRIVELRRLGL